MQRAYVKYFETSMCEHISFYYFFRALQSSSILGEKNRGEKEKSTWRKKKITLKPRAEQVQVGKWYADIKKKNKNIFYEYTAPVDEEAGSQGGEKLWATAEGTTLKAAAHTMLPNDSVRQETREAVR